jgi:FixJ family two-component response regulator
MILDSMSSTNQKSENPLLTRRKIIAVVEDDPSTLDAIGLLLDAYGFEAKLFGSAEEFLERGGADKVDCLLLDIHLGGLSGIGLRLRLEASGSTLPVIFMTALDDEGTRGQALRAGCIAYLQKQVLSRALMDAIDKAAP